MLVVPLTVLCLHVRVKGVVPVTSHASSVGKKRVVECLSSFVQFLRGEITDDSVISEGSGAFDPAGLLIPA